MTTIPGNFSLTRERIVQILNGTKNRFLDALVIEGVITEGQSIIANKYMLEYEDTNNFGRAFNAASGNTPKESYDTVVLKPILKSFHIEKIDDLEPEKESDDEIDHLCGKMMDMLFAAAANLETHGASASRKLGEDIKDFLKEVGYEPDCE